MDKMRRTRLWIALESLLAGSLLVPATGHTQSSGTVAPQDEYKQLIQTGQTIQPLGEHPFGENISLYDGTLSFEETDVSVPGIGPSLQLGRSLKTADGTQYNLDAQRPFGDWDLDIPRIETITADLAGGWTVGNNRTGRCSNFGPPPTVTDPQTGDPWGPDQYWYGYHLIIPGHGSQNLLGGGSPSNAHAPSSGTYPIVTTQDWMIACGTPASDGGEEFIAWAPDGTRYTFSHLVYRPMPEVTKPRGTGPLAVPASGAHPMIAGFDIVTRHEALMYVTKIEDRFGNTLVYNWDPNNPNQLVSIVDSKADGTPDGRELDFTYDSGHPYLIDRVTVKAAGGASARTWTYSYDTAILWSPCLPRSSYPMDTRGPSRWAACSPRC